MAEYLVQQWKKSPQHITVYHFENERKKTVQSNEMTLFMFILREIPR